MKPVIAIVGRANVGKSALFNRLVGTRIAIVEDLPGTTRDRIIADATLQDREVTFIDTGGLEIEPDSDLIQKVKTQAEAALAEADIIIFVVDITTGLITAEQEIADQLRRSRKPVIVVANKSDKARLGGQVADFYQLGLGTPIAVSAYHGRNIFELSARIISLIPESAEDYSDPTKIKLAIVGRPNAGKSMLLNAITGQDRVIVDHVPGTTRDAIDTTFQWEGQDIVLIDTAGIKRRGRAGTGVDYYSLIRSMRAINRCDIALLVADATDPLTAQDVHIAGYIRDAGKGMILVFNKWDLISGHTKDEYSKWVRYRLKFTAHTPVHYVSAIYRQGVDKLIPKAMAIWQERQRQLPDDIVNDLIKDAVAKQAPPRKGTRRLNVIRSYQAGINPPTFAFVVNDPELVHFSYQRYLENKLRQTFGFSGTSLRLFFKKAPKTAKTRGKSK